MVPLRAAILAKTTLLVGLAACGSSGGGGGGPVVVGEHPFLLMRPADAPALAARASTSPWREMAQEAVRFARDETFDPGASDFQAFRRMMDLCGALALAHVVAPNPAQVDKLVATLSQWPAYFIGVAPSGNGLLVRWQQSAMVESILALDVFHDDLAPDQRAELEAMLDGMVRTWWDERAQDGTTSTPGLVALWAIYADNEPLAAQATALFLDRLFGELAPSGVFDSGSGYAWVRQGGDRISKYALIDVLEFTGRDRSLYSDPRLIGLHEWMYGGAFTPALTNLTFGDSDPSRPVEGVQGYVQPYRAGRFSEGAGRNAAWMVQDTSPHPLFSSYVLLDASVLAPEAPTSRGWGDSATFWEDARTPDSLMAALWCPRSSSSHSHLDVNAVHLYAYGRNVVRNSGYCGSNQGVDAVFDWDWIHSDARSSNTVLLDGAEHAARSGAGVVEVLTTPVLDHATADSGAALPNGTHRRSLWLVHGAPDLGGYFVLLDQIESALPDAEAEILVHPDSAAVSTITPDERYRWSLPDGSSAPLSLDVFLATPPTRTEMLDGGLCAFDGDEFVGRYLDAHHHTGAEAKVGILTVLFPHDADHALPPITRLSAPGLTGATLGGAPGPLDVVLESAGTVPVATGAQTVRARGAWYRLRGAACEAYFLAQGRLFDSGANPAVGLESSMDLVALVHGVQAHVHSDGATVTFRDPGLSGNTFSTEAGVVLSAHPGAVEILLHPGSHAFDLNTGLPLP